MDLGILSQLLILLFVSMLLGVLFSKFKIPDVVAYILTGVLVGNGFLKIVSPSVPISDIESVSLFFIILAIGVEANTEYIYGNVRRSIILTISSFIAPSMLGFLYLQAVAHLPIIPAFVLSMSVGVPSISIISVLLMRYDLLKLNAGRLILSSVVLTDTSAFIILSSTYESVTKVLISFGFVVLFLFAIWLFDILIRRRAGRIIEWISRRETDNNMEYILFSLVIIAGLLVSTLFEFIGITYVLGAFYAGILIHEASIGQKYHKIILNTIKRINDSFFIPLFFSIAGISMILPKISIFMIFLPALLILMGASGGLTYLVSHRLIRSLEPIKVVSILGGRGAVGVIIATIAFQSGIIDVAVYSLALIGTVIFSLVMTPLVSIGNAPSQNDDVRYS
ncbi:Na+/H+ antiporter [Thermoplasma volcanium GSS1]|uniref:Na+/H+ antiporter n=1 Tax=Thermoplasma volcanium (strain ATCC 51530 / DSM 4299 / JCM 9571 / NBRC 15438 / GSS1) TaxID=273116 RepID=Q97BQ9_THEVO|nr:cation:proton antiporter [Thermoplasma volcanium]BAB59538.1 Na+/H+ antiporter [Thermoplasma volcanium GSS1]